MSFFVLINALIVSSTLMGNVKLWNGVADGIRNEKSEIRVFMPDAAASNGIGVIICPGGSYSHLALGHEGRDVAMWLNEKGYTAFVLRYRVSMGGNHHPAMMQDVQRAMQLVKENAAEYGVDPDKVGIMGFSAGGHLAGALGTYYDTDYLGTMGLEYKTDLRPAFVAMVYPVVSMEDNIAHRRSRRNLLGKAINDDKVKNAMSLEKQVRADMPPVFITACRDDATVDYRNSVVYHEALLASGIDHAFHLYEKGNHGYGILPKDPDNDWAEKFIEWLDGIGSATTNAGSKN